MDPSITSGLYSHATKWRIELGPFIMVEVRGDPHEVFRPGEGGLTRIRCFRVVVVVSSSDPKNVKFPANIHPGLDADDKKS